MHGLSEIGKNLRDDIEQILEAIVTRLRVDPSFSRTAALNQGSLEDHMLSFLTNAIQSLIIVDETAGLDSELMKDGTKIQAFIAGMHGAQRRRIGWTEPMLIEEYRYIEAELAGRVRHMDVHDSADTTLALGILARLLEGATGACIRGFRASATVTDSPSPTNPEASPSG